jgi:cation diffusion facilitator family transporter
MAPPRAIERPALLRSIAVAAVLGALGIVWGLATGSQMILLDGIYGVIGILLSWLLLRASALADEGPSKAYPFGREAFTPFVIGIQGFVLLATLLYAAVEAVYVILDGGSSVTAGWAIAYGVVTTVSSLAVWRWLHGVAASSDLLRAEAIAWRVAAFRGTGMIIGFAVLGMLTGSEWDGAAPYVDPIMVLVTCALFVWSPIAMVRSTLLELLERVPPDEISEPVQRAVDAVSTRFHLDPPPDVRVAKLGPKLYVEVEGTVSPTVTVAQEHELREDLQRRLDALPYDVWLNVTFEPRRGDSWAGQGSNL